MYVCVYACVRVYVRGCVSNEIECVCVRVHVRVRECVGVSAPAGLSIFVLIYTHIIWTHSYIYIWGDQYELPPQSAYLFSQLAISVCMCVCVCVCVCVCACMCVCVCVRARVYTHTVGLRIAVSHY